MSKMAIISDIHANIDALKLVLNDIEKKNINEIICLGDLVTKYFYPAEVVDAIKENCKIVIKGNCDELVSTNENYRFARKQLGIDRIDYLKNLPLSYKIHNINYYHSSPNSIDKIFNPLFSGNQYTDYKNKIITDYTEMFEENQISIVGHTHQSYIGIEDNNSLQLVEKTKISDKRIIINSGSSGEHSHMIINNLIPETIIDPFLTYIILDEYVEIIKVPYKELLKNIYFNIVKLQDENKIPYSPNDTKKIEKSLRLMC